MDYRVSYAQNREDIILEAFFPERKEGFYADVGANDPTHDSVTKLFYDKGWRGINIEPNKRIYEQLCEKRPLDTNLNIGVSDSDGLLKFREYPDGDGLSTFSKEIQDKYETSRSDLTDNFHEYDVAVETLASIFESCKIVQINFMKIDIEGHEYFALKGNDWERFRPQVICIEANHLVDDWRPLLRRNKYDHIFFDGLNDYYVAAEASEIAQRFSYPEHVLMGPLIVPYRAEQEFNRYRQSIEEHLTAKKEVDSQLNALRAQLYSSQGRIRYTAKTLTRQILGASVTKLSGLFGRNPTLFTGVSGVMPSTELEGHYRARLYLMGRYYVATRSQRYQPVFRLYGFAKKRLRALFEQARSV